jgi:TetR/AcrR family transcriptional repressor of nem operon
MTKIPDSLLTVRSSYTEFELKVSRNNIVLAARELFRERGYSGASMQDIADRIGLKKASLYTRFEHKEALVQEVLQLTLNETFDDQKLSGLAWNVAYSVAIKSIAAVLTDRKRCVGMHLAYGVGAATPEAQAAVRSYFMQLRGRLVGILSQATSREHATEMASDAISRIEGATVWLTTLDDVSPMRRAVKSILADAEEITSSEFKHGVGARRK